MEKTKRLTWSTSCGRPSYQEKRKENFNCKTRSTQAHAFAFMRYGVKYGKNLTKANKWNKKRNKEARPSCLYSASFGQGKEERERREIWEKTHSSLGRNREKKKRRRRKCKKIKAKALNSKLISKSILEVSCILKWNQWWGSSSRNELEKIGSDKVYEWKLTHVQFYILYVYVKCDIVLTLWVWNVVL